MKTVKISDDIHSELELMSEKTGLKMYRILEKGFQLWMVDNGFWKPGQTQRTPALVKANGTKTGAGSKKRGGGNGR